MMKDLYDFIICEYPLSFPQEVASSSEFSSHKWDEHKFLSKSFTESVFDSYTISPYGELYKTIEERDSNGKITSSKIEKQEDFTGEIVFYDLMVGQDRDYWVEFIAIFYDGKLIGIKNRNFESADNTERKERELQLFKEWETEQKRQNNIFFATINYFRLLIAIPFKICKLGLLFLLKYVNRLDNFILKK